MHHGSVYRRKPGVVAVAGRRDLTCWAPAYALIATSRFKFATSRAKAVGRLPSTKVERTASSGVGRRCGAMRPLSGGEAPRSRRLVIIRDLGPSAPLASRQHSFWGRASTFRVICRRRCLTMKYLSPIDIHNFFLLGDFARRSVERDTLPMRESALLETSLKNEAFEDRTPRVAAPSRNTSLII